MKPNKLNSVMAWVVMWALVYGADLAAAGDAFGLAANRADREDAAGEHAQPDAFAATLGADGLGSGIGSQLITVLGGRWSGRLINSRLDDGEQVLPVQFLGPAVVTSPEAHGFFSDLAEDGVVSRPFLKALFTGIHWKTKPKGSKVEI